MFQTCIDTVSDLQPCQWELCVIYISVIHPITTFMNCELYLFRFVALYFSHPSVLENPYTSLCLKFFF